MKCPAYEEARRDMVREGGHDTRIMGKLLSDGKLLKHLFRYIDRTKRFMEMAGELEEMR